MLDFRRATVFCLGYRLSKHKITRYAKNFGEAWAPGYAHARVTFFTDLLDSSHNELLDRRPRYIRGCCLMLERRYGFRAGAWCAKALF